MGLVVFQPIFTLFIIFLSFAPERYSPGLVEENELNQLSDLFSFLILL